MAYSKVGIDSSFAPSLGRPWNSMYPVIDGMTGAQVADGLQGFAGKPVLNGC